MCASSLFVELLTVPPIEISDEETEGHDAARSPCVVSARESTASMASAPRPAKDTPTPLRQRCVPSSQNAGEGARMGAARLTPEWYAGEGIEDPPSPSAPSNQDVEHGCLAFEDDDDECADFIPEGAICGAAASAILGLTPTASQYTAALRPLPGPLRALLPTQDLSAPRELAAAEALTPAQTKAVRLVALEARPKSEAAVCGLKERLKSWGYAQHELMQVLRYIRDEAPIIIHVDLATRLDWLERDTHYRNQFETNSTKGSNNLAKRASWEDRLFRGIYLNAKPFDRVKYGVLNAMNDPRGVNNVAKQYGLDYLVLRGVRLRTTFSDRDSCTNGQLASCEWYAHVLSEYSDAELRRVVEVAVGERAAADSALLEAAAGGYKEVQIHGELRLDQDVEAVVMHPSRLGTSLGDGIKEWCRKLGCRLECPTGTPDAGSFSGENLPVALGGSLWRWGVPENGAGPLAVSKAKAANGSDPDPTWLRFDFFASALLEARWLGRDCYLPSFPVGTTSSLSLDDMSMTVVLDLVEVSVSLERLAPTSGSEEAAPLWEWSASVSGADSAWTAYSDPETKALEAGMRQGKRVVSIAHGGKDYDIDIGKMLQVNRQTGFNRKVRRRLHHA